ncbi:MAG: fructose-bisphosphate aldolase class I [Candidatus Marinimicrobia bacterium]|nr:fructose-bisphosphate aldolase class I [Candidatus Neomarinimicrobiota bacterium]
MVEELKRVANAIVAAGKGILAADESTGTIKKRFDSIGAESSEQNRNIYRDMLFTTEGMENFISGVIMFDETLRQSTVKNGIPFPEYLSSKGVLPGIKVDKGAKLLAGQEGEKVTEGLDGLRDRLKEYYDIGAKFAKWRAVITIGEGIPSRACIEANAHALARYAALCQEAGIVPIVEPEVLMDGDHTIDTCFEETEETLEIVFDELFKQGVSLEGMILKPNMIISALECPEQANIEEVAVATIECFLRVVPAAVPGICFLSGGQSDIIATRHLNAMNAMDISLPWRLSFSYGRALQAAALKTWVGKDDNILAAQRAFYHRAKCNSAATLGTYSEEMEKRLQI